MTLFQEINSADANSVKGGKTSRLTYIISRTNVIRKPLWRAGWPLFFF